MTGDWRKSSYSLANGNCPEVAFRRSSRSMSNGQCAEVAAGGTRGVLVRDSKDPDGPVLAFSGSTWGVWVAAVKADARSG